MPHFYFHLTIDDEHFPDLTGEQAGDLAAAHSRAVSFASGVMWLCALDGQAPRTERGVVTVQDETGGTVLSVIVRYENAHSDRHEAVARHDPAPAVKPAILLP